MHLDSLFVMCSFCILYSIYAIGDCIHGPMLAHKAEDEGAYVFASLSSAGALPVPMTADVLCFMHQPNH